MIGIEPALFCLAVNLYFEGGSSNEPADGLFAISFVVINRSIERKKTICQTVFQKHQFSWTINALDKNNHLMAQYRPKNTQQWRNCKTIAALAMQGQIRDFTDGAMYYYADYIRTPSWARNMRETGRWGSHHFLKDGIKHEL